MAVKFHTTNKVYLGTFLLTTQSELIYEHICVYNKIYYNIRIILLLLLLSIVVVFVQKYEQCGYYITFINFIQQYNYYADARQGQDINLGNVFYVFSNIVIIVRGFLLYT